MHRKWLNQNNNFNNVIHNWIAYLYNIVTVLCKKFRQKDITSYENNYKVYFQIACQPNCPKFVRNRLTFVAWKFRKTKGYIDLPFISFVILTFILVRKQYNKIYNHIGSVMGGMLASSGRSWDQAQVESNSRL